MKSLNYLFIFGLVFLLVFISNPFSVLGEKPDIVYDFTEAVSSCSVDGCESVPLSNDGSLVSGDFEFKPMFDLIDDGRLMVEFNGLDIEMTRGQIVELQDGVRVRYTEVGRSVKSVNDGSSFKDVLGSVAYRFEFFIDPEKFTDINFDGTTKAPLRQPHEFYLDIGTLPSENWNGGLKLIKSSDMLFSGKTASFERFNLPGIKTVRTDTSLIGIVEYEAQPFITFKQHDKTYDVLSNEMLEIEVNVQPVSEVFGELESGRVIMKSGTEILDLGTYNQIIQKPGNENILIVVIVLLLAIVGYFIRGKL